MKKTILALATMLCAATASAQILDFEGMPPYKLGITAALNVPYFSRSGYDCTIGLQAGADLMVDASDLIKNTYGRTQVLYTMKGSTLSTSYGDYYYTTHYIEIPIHYGYAWMIDADWTITAETGPYLAVGLGGTERPESKIGRSSRTFFNGCNASRFDYGWGLQAGLLFEQQLMLNVGYELGFKNMNSTFLQNRNFYIGLTYFIDY